MIFLDDRGGVTAPAVYDDQAQCVTVKGVTYRMFEWLTLEISVHQHRTCRHCQLTSLFEGRQVAAASPSSGTEDHQH